MNEAQLLPNVVVRPAGSSDSRPLFEWRNDALSRAMSHTTDEVAWADHERWFASTLDRADRVLLIGEVGDERIGMVRFDLLAPDRYEMSINLAPAARGRGLGTALLAAGHAYLGEHTDARTVVAEVKPGNAVSLRMCERVGYVETDRTDTMVTLIYRYAEA